MPTLQTLHRKCTRRHRLESLDESKTVNKFMDLIGRGQCSVQAAAEIARDVVTRLQCFFWVISFRDARMLILKFTS